MADNNSKKYLSGDNLKYTLQQLKTKLDETYSTIEYVDKADDFIFAELIESQNHLKATNSQMATNLLELGNPLYQQQLAEEGKAGRFCFNIENDISDYYTGTFMHILFLDSNDKAVLYRTGRTASDSNMQISISNGVLPSGTIFNGTCRITKNKIYEYGESITTVESVGKSCVMISIPIASNTEAIINELKTLKVKVLLTKPNFLTFDNNNEFVPTKDYHPTTKKYVDDHFITDIYEDALVITAEEMNSSNNGGRGIYIDKIKTLDPAGFNVDFIYYGYYKDAVAVLTYSTQFNMFYCNRMDKNGSQSIGICMGAGNGNLIPMNNGTQDVKDYQFTEDLIIRKRILLSPNTTATKGYVDDAIVELMDSNSVNDYEIAKVNAKVSSIYNTKMQVLDGKFTDNVTYYTDADYSVTPQIGAKYAINIQKIIDGIGVNDVFTTVFKYKANGEDYTDSYTFETGISTGTIVSVELTMAGGTVDALFRINAYKEYNSDISLVDSEHCSVYITFSKDVSVELIDEIVNSMDLSVFLGSLNVLTLNNKEAYTPATDYQPATKKYVDEKTAGCPQISNTMIIDSANSKQCIDFTSGTQTMRHNLYDYDNFDSHDFSTLVNPTIEVTLENGDVLSVPLTLSAKYGILSGMSGGYGITVCWDHVDENGNTVTDYDTLRIIVTKFDITTYQIVYHKTTSVKFNATVVHQLMNGALIDKIDYSQITNSPLRILTGKINFLDYVQQDSGTEVYILAGEDTSYSNGYFDPDYYKNYIYYKDGFSKTSIMTCYNMNFERDESYIRLANYVYIYEYVSAGYTDGLGDFRYFRYKDMCSYEDFVSRGYTQARNEYYPTEDFNLTTKKYVDDKTEILPVKNNYVIFEDAIPVSTEAASTYGTGGGGGNINNFNIFDNLQNTDMIVRAMKFNLTISFNDGTEDITENIIVDADEQIGFSGFVNDFYIDLTYDANYNLIEILVVKEIETDSGWEQTFYTITKATFICSSYSNLLKNTAIESIKYKKITQVPEKLSGLNTGTYKSLDIKQYVHLYDNSFVWDMNKINERLDETSGVTENTTATTVGGRVIKVNQKDSEGIGFGQLVPINNKHPLKIFFKAGKDVIVKVYNPNTKELISTINSDIRDPFNYTESGVYTSYLTGLDNIFVAFTIKDNTTENSTNRFIHDLVVTDSESLLKKEEILTKANTKEYVPTADYHPATKKYVDENNRLPLLSSILKKNEDGSLYKHNNMYHCLDFDLIPKDATVTYYDDISTKNVLNATFLLIWKDDNAISQVFGLRSTYPIIRIGYRTSQQLLNFTNTFYSINYNFETNEKTTSELYSLSSRPSTSAVLTKTNTTEYTPTDDYHPATKKYVDDNIANAGTQSDWNETDPAAASYIQNRTHGESDDTWVVYAEGDFNNRRQVNEQGYDDGFLWDSVNISTIKTGEIMRVTFDGQVYECPALKIDRMIYFGNGAAVNYVGQKFESLSDLVSNDEPFFCYLDPEGTSTTYSELHIKFKPKPLCSHYSIKVERKGAGVFIIDEKYLPPLIGRPGYNTGAEVFNYSSNEARGLYSHAEGYNTYASGSYSHAEGYGDNMPPDDLENLYILSDEELIDFDSRYAIAAGIASHTEGYFNIAIGEYSHAEGSSTIARGSSSHTEGMSTRAIGGASHAEGEYSVAIEDSSHAEGCGTAAYGYGSHTEGSGSMTTENGYYAHAEGIDTIAASRAQHVQGKWNVEDANNQYAHIVGNGTDDDDRSNAHTLDWDGNAWYQGNVSVDGTPTNDNDLTTKKYVDDNKFSGDYNDLDNKPFLNLPKHSDSTEAFYIVDVKELVVGCKYIITEIQTTNIKFRYYYDESNYKAIAIVAGAAKNIIEVYASAVTETKVQFYVDNILYTVDNIDSSAKTSTVTKTAISLKTDNTIAYTPTNNYHPATKKYVDDLVNNSKEDLTEEDIDTMLSDIFGTIE